MKVKIGDKVKIRNYKNPGEGPVYTVLEINGSLLKLKHPSVGGYFGAKLDSVTEVLNEDR